MSLYWSGLACKPINSDEFIYTGTWDSNVDIRAYNAEILSDSEED